MVAINGYDIELTRGDSLFLRVNLSGRDLPEGTDAVFTVKRNVRSDEVLLRKRFDASDEVVGIQLSSRETRLDPGVYVWDLRLQIPQEDGTVEIHTPMEYAAFVVLESVGEPVEENEADVTADVRLVIKEARAAIAQANAAADKASAAAQAAHPAEVPTYWKTAVSRAAAEVRSAQDQCGSQGVCFAFCSDMHIHEGDTNYARSLGRIAGAVMDQADVPLLVNCGDLMTNDSVAVEIWMKPCFERAWADLQPVRDRMLLLQGNHDGAWGAYTAADPSGAYTRNLAPEKLWQYLFRPQSAPFARVYGPTGAYYYVDLASQKTRFICLNSHDGQWSQHEDGTVVWNTMTGGYTQQQIDFLADALNVAEGWCVVIASHVPPTGLLPTDYSHIRCTDLLRGVVTAYALRGTYAGSYAHQPSRGEGAWADASVSVDFTGAKGEIAGWFCGHAHRDAMLLGDLPFPVITITSAGNFSYDQGEAERVFGTDGETAVDFVTINKTSRTLTLVRLGTGQNRQCSYEPMNVNGVNQLPLATDDDGTVFNGKGWKEGYRISASSGAVSANAATDLTGYIPVSIGSRVTFVNMLMPMHTSNVGVHFYAEAASGAKLHSSVGWDGSTGFPGTTWDCTLDDSGNVLSFVVPDWTELQGVTCMRVAATDITDESVITVEE